MHTGRGVWGRGRREDKATGAWSVIKKNKGEKNVLHKIKPARYIITTFVWWITFITRREFGCSMTAENASPCSARYCFSTVLSRHSLRTVHRTRNRPRIVRFVYDIMRIDWTRVSGKTTELPLSGEKTRLFLLLFFFQLICIKVSTNLRRTGHDLSSNALLHMDMCTTTIKRRT